jgi:hypothetical protein
MRNVRPPLRLDWDDINRTILQNAASQLLEAAVLRADLSNMAITISHIAPDRVRLSVRQPDLIRQEQGDITAAPDSFLMPTAQDRVALRDTVIAHIRKTIA